MSDNFEFDVFISHGARDEGIARELAQRLSDDGLCVWLDDWKIRPEGLGKLMARLGRFGAWLEESEIQPDDLIDTRVKRGLNQSRTLVLIMSDNISAAEWAVLESCTAEFRNPSNALRRFIPLRIDNCEIKETLRQFAFVDFRQTSDAEYSRLLALCKPPASRSQNRPAVTTNGRISLLSHASHVYSAAISDDGLRALSGSFDNTVRLWDLATGDCLVTLEGHTSGVWGVALSRDGRHALSGSEDRTVRVWHLETGTCLAILEGHTDRVRGLALSSDGELALSGSFDGTVRVWDLKRRECLRVLKGHKDKVRGVAISGDGRLAVSGSGDRTLRVWDVSTGHCLAVLEGHTDSVWGVALSSDGRLALSGSFDKTVRVWNVEKRSCLAILEGHTYGVWNVVLSNDGRLGLSASGDHTARVWDVSTGRCLAILEGHDDNLWGLAITSDGKQALSVSVDGKAILWALEELEGAASSRPHQDARYTNAKVVLVGESGAGKTGLALRLCEDRWKATESTHGMLISQLNLTSETNPGDIDREVWLWDFAGQPDYRLIHQLYMDETALCVVVFDPQDDNPFENIGYWEKALYAATKASAIVPSKLLVGARCDRGGITVSRKRFDQYCVQHGFAGLWLTGAKTGEGCSELRDAITKHIPWDRLPYTSTTLLFKSLKDALLKLKEQDMPLIRLSELRQRLQLMMPGETSSAEELRTVIGLMQGQGVLQVLDFGDFVLLQPEQINRYASVMVRMAREHVDEMGCVAEQTVLNGQLDYKDMERLSETDENILLPAMVQTFLDRALCLRETTSAGIMLVFPSYFRRDKPEVPEYPNVFVTYGFAGPLDEIYATLVVKLSYSGGFVKDQLWKDAADLRTQGGKRVGLALRRKVEGSAELVIYFEQGVPDDTKVTFIKYVHEHLMARAQEVTRVRTYVCPHCDTPVENRKAIQLRLNRGLKDIICPACEKRVQLIDLIEEKFASDEFTQRVREMDERARINLDNESRELILVGHAFAIAGEAGQIYRQYTNSDHGIDGEIEFKDYEGKASGQRLYLQLKSGDSYLYTRKEDGAEIFTIKKERWVDYWQKQAYPVMLVIRTSDGQIRWMNISEYLQQSKGKKQVVFNGEPFTALHVTRLRDQIFAAGLPPHEQG